MERITLSGLVKLAKYLAADKTVFATGININYDLDITNFDLLQREIHFHNEGNMTNYKSIIKYSFEVMSIKFNFTRH